MSHIFSPDHFLPFFNATKLLKEPFEEAIKDMCNKLQEDQPSCVISDWFLGWTNASCLGFGIPRLVFHGMGVYAIAVKKSLSIYQTHVNKGLDFNVIILNVKGVQLSFALSTADLSNSLMDMESEISRFFLEAEKSDLGSWGVIANSFVELEKDYVGSLESLYGNETKAFCVGPLFLYEQILEGNRFALNLKEPANPQTNPSRTNRDRSKGLIVKEWVDQKWILAHKAIGGFLSHCRWNSTLESLANGVPILAWPMQAEQHLNAKYLVEELKIGLRVPNFKRDVGNIVERTLISKGVRELMGGKRGKQAREKAIEFWKGG
ncbi:hypothetical protein FNV43_RR11678 [Rhamnella rubrinervis]|uniref:UDP-glycosyltransferase n=1 Tax=Rhamnella rubrinervis TaxID=2594499 RepID=A0A8K0H6G1_9ROSA|nr:hypothetical protein FNV43_RR11678 [Rhamnella rubrinervis]